jgi:hypothetical protein
MQPFVDSSERTHMDFLRRRLPLLTAILAAVVVWLVFAPGNLSYDSFLQYRQALAHTYSNWHPPIMAIMLAIVMFYGGGIGTLMLLQCVAGVLGVRAWALAVIEQLSRDRWTPRRLQWTATLVALVMLLPATPTACYVMTFWKDSWTAIEFLWVAALGLRLFGRCDAMPRRAFWLQFGGLAALMALTGITRHNALVALPAMGGMLWLILARRRVRLAWLSIALPAALSILASAAIEWAFCVEPYRPEEQVKILELVGICVAYPECREEFPYVAAHLTPNGAASYRFGNIFSLTDPAGPVIKGTLWSFGDKETLDAEYRHAVAAHPWRLLWVKCWAFCRLFDPANLKSSYCQQTLDANDFGLHHNRRFARPRAWIVMLLDASLETPFLAWIAYHNIWFSLDLAVIAGLLIRFVRGPARQLAFWLIVMAIPLCYALSYFAAVTGMDYRFLYPSTLFVQVAALAAAMFFCIRWVESRAAHD